MDAEPLSSKRNPKFLARAADTGFLKKIHTCAPLPDLDLSTNGVMPLLSQMRRSASTSSCHSSSTFVIFFNYAFIYLCLELLGLSGNVIFNLPALTSGATRLIIV